MSLLRGVQVIREFQEFQELKTSQSHFKRQKLVAKIKRRQMFDRRAFTPFRTESSPLMLNRSCFQLFNFPHLSIHQEAFTTMVFTSQLLVTTYHLLVNS